MWLVEVCSPDARLHVMAVSTVIALSSAVPSQPSAQITGAFGNIRYSEASGDVFGTEIVIFRTSSGYRVQFQTAEGVPGPVDTVSATVRGDSIFFELPPDSVPRFKEDGTPYFIVSERVFRGRVTAKRLSGRLSSWYDELDLPRRAP